MKKLISLMLTLAMLAAVVPAALTRVSAEDATPKGNWTDDGNFDLSWCKTLDSKTSETLELNGKYYHIMAWTNQTYHITNAKQLAGLAYLSNLASGDIFKGDKFMIEENLDLSAHYWIPICQTENKSKFRGSLIGNVNGGAATITGMTIDTSDKQNVYSGLIGQFGGDWIENLRLENAAITANSYYVGSFVAWQNSNVGSGLVYGKREGGYRNLYADTRIVLTSGRSDKRDDVGGIVGYISNCTNVNDPTTVITKCVFTGTITAPNADTVGGILAYFDGQNIDTEQRAPIITDCVVISEKLEFGKAYVGNEWETGFGGIAGNLFSAKSGEKADTVPSSVSNCYVAAKLIALDSDDTSRQTNVGGIVGASCDQTKTYTNCQFDGIIVGAATYRRTAGILGRSRANTSFTSCVISGVALGMDNSGNLNASRLGGTGVVPTVSNVYTSVKMSYCWNTSWQRRSPPIPGLLLCLTRRTRTATQSG